MWFNFTSISSVLCEQMVCELVRGEQRVEKQEQNLLSLLCSAQQDDYWRLTQRVASIIETRREVGILYSKDFTKSTQLTI